MKNKILSLLTLGILGAMSTKAEEPVRTLNQTITAEGIDSIALEFPVGQLTVEGWDQPRVEMEVRLECRPRKKSCLHAAEAVQIISATEDRALHVELQGWPKHRTRKMQANALVRVPRNLPLAAELGVGNVRVTGVTSDLSVDLGVGDVNLTLSESSISSVNVDVGLGDAFLSAHDKRYVGSGLVGKKLNWEGSGQAELKVDCGVGDVNVDLQ